MHPRKKAPSHCSVHPSEGDEPRHDMLMQSRILFMCSRNCADLHIPIMLILERRSKLIGISDTPLLVRGSVTDSRSIEEVWTPALQSWMQAKDEPRFFLGFLTLRVPCLETTKEGCKCFKEQLVHLIHNFQGSPCLKVSGLGFRV